MLNETGYEAMLKASGDEEDEERLANIQELLTVAREFDERHPGAVAADLEAFLEETALVNDTDEWETQLDRVTLMTLARLEGAGVSLRLPRRRGRGAAAARAQPRPGRAVGGGAAADVRRHHAGPAAVADQPGPISRLPRRAEAGDSQFVSHGTAARRDGGPAAGNDARRGDSSDLPEDHEPVFRRDEPRETRDR